MTRYAWCPPAFGDFGRLGQGLEAMRTPTVAFCRAPDVPADWPAPAYQTEGAAGFDLPAYIPHQFTQLPPGMRIWVRTGWRIAVPPGYEGSVRSRSGLAVKKGIAVFNAPGTVDADFRGEMMVCLYNGNLHERHREPRDRYRNNPILPDAANQEAHDNNGRVTIRHGDRIAQVVITPVCRATLAVVDALDSTARGDGGWGSTGR